MEKTVSPFSRPNVIVVDGWREANLAAKKNDSEVISHEKDSRIIGHTPRFGLAGFYAGRAERGTADAEQGCRHAAEKQGADQAPAAQAEHAPVSKADPVAEQGEQETGEGREVKGTARYNYRNL